MHFQIETIVSGHYKDIFKGFDGRLFEALNPPLLKMELIRFDGCHVGDEVHVLLALAGISRKWVSVITENVELENEHYFVDEGKLLPPPLRQWQHKHRIIKIDNKTSKIVDDINYSCGSTLTDRLVYAGIVAPFVYRQHIYRRWFSNQSP